MADGDIDLYADAELDNEFGGTGYDEGLDNVDLYDDVIAPSGSTTAKAEKDSPLPGIPGKDKKNGLLDTPPGGPLLAAGPDGRAKRVAMYIGKSNYHNLFALYSYTTWL